MTLDAGTEAGAGNAGYPPGQLQSRSAKIIDAFVNGSLENCLIRAALGAREGLNSCRLRRRNKSNRACCSRSKLRARNSKHVIHSHTAIPDFLEVLRYFLRHGLVHAAIHLVEA